MADYILFPTGYQGLGYEMKKLVDDYNSKKITLMVFLGTLRAWQENCDFMFGEDGNLAPGLERIIGKRRAKVVVVALSQKLEIL